MLSVNQLEFTAQGIASTKYAYPSFNNNVPDWVNISCEFCVLSVPTPAPSWLESCKPSQRYSSDFERVWKIIIINDKICRLIFKVIKTNRINFSENWKFRV